MLHVPGKHLELKCTLESQPDALMLHQVCRSLPGLCQGWEVQGWQWLWTQSTVQLCRGICTIANRVCRASSPWCVWCFTAWVSQEPYPWRCCVANSHVKSLVHGELLHAGFWVHGAGSCPPCSYPQLELLPLVVFHSEFPYVQAWYDLWWAEQQHGALETCRVFLSCKHNWEAGGCFHNISHVKAQARGADMGTALRWLWSVCWCWMCPDVTAVRFYFVRSSCLRFWMQLIIFNLHNK